MHKCAVFPGSFDPVHRGHIQILDVASELFTDVDWAIGKNSEKNPLFTVDERLDMMEQIASCYLNVHVKKYEGLLAHYVTKNNLGYIVRSLRSTLDFDYENKITVVNKQFAPNTQTIYIPCLPKYAHLSSSLIRELHKFGEEIDERIVPRIVAKKLNERLK